jgi:two-component system nitrate/nitrite response regulator NarL
MGAQNAASVATRRTRIVVADPYPVIVQGVRKMIEDDSRFQVIAEASTLPTFCKKVIAERPEVALLDWSMASQDIDLTTALLESSSHSTAIIFLTVSEDSIQKREMLKLGARTFLSKWCSARRLRTAVRKACHAGISDETLPTEVAAADKFAVPFLAHAEERMKQLTRRERQLLPLVCSGLRNKEIAHQLGIAESTVWHHLTAVFTKLQVEDRLGLVAFAYSHRLVSPPARRRSEPNLGFVESLPRSVRYQPAADVAVNG